MTTQIPRPTLPNIDIDKIDSTLSQAITPGIFWLAIILALLFVAIMTAVLRWHWRRYALNTKTEKKMIRMYYLGMFVGVSALIISGIMYTLNYSS